MPLSDVLHHRTLATDILYGLKHRLTNGEHGSDGEPSVMLNVFLRLLLRLPQYTRTNLIFVSLFNYPAVAYRVLLLRSIVSRCCAAIIRSAFCCDAYSYKQSALTLADSCLREVLDSSYLR